MLLQDTGLALKIKAALLADERIGGLDVHVESADGGVTLRGTVDNPAQRELAEAVAVRQGARQVRNELRVRESHTADLGYIPADAPRVTAPAGAEVVEEPSLEEEIRRALKADRRVNERLVLVDVDATGVAYLSGRQDTVQARDAATEAVSRVPGVTAVSNDLEVQPSV